ncbi:MAG: YqgE/AlgH family protein [Bacteroides sp.]|nr:YqgE/AlgH family protein [Bacteroides sp.]
MDLKDLLYSHISGSIPGQGSLLIADPMMHGDFFSRSVIIILDLPEKGGELGLVLNKETHLTLKDLIPDWEEGIKVPVFSGGPVDMDRLFLLHTLKDVFPDAMEVCPGIYVGGNVDDIINYINSGGEVEGKMRFFLGYSGWAPNQLQREIERHSWAVNPSPSGEDLLNGEGMEYWRREVEQLGSDYRSWLMVPPDPSYN